MGVEQGGAFPVLPTIFDASGEVDEEGFRTVAEFVIACGVDGVVFPGLASEYDQLSLHERFQLIEIVGDLCRGRASFIVGASAATGAESAAMADAGTKAGAEVAMIVTPGRFAGRPDELVQFYRKIGESGPPIMLQNAPSPMGLGLAPAAVRAIVEAVPAIHYVKEENMPCGHGISTLLADPPKNLKGVFGGAGGRYIIDELSRGAIGTMPAAELPEISVALMAAHRRSDQLRVRELHERMLPVLMMQAIFRWDLTKEILRRRGLIANSFTRAPGPRLDIHDREELAILLERLDELSALNESGKAEAAA